MAFEIGSVSSLQFSRAAQATPASVSSSAGSGRIQSVNSGLPDTLVPSRTSGRVILNIKQATTAVATSLVASAGVLSSLRALESGLQIAISDGLTSNSTLLINGDGTRISRVIITAQANRVLSAIDSLVDSAAIGSANLISSDSPRITLQTTDFGGRVTVSPQSLDTAGLGIADLSALSRRDAQAALASVQIAIGLAERRSNNLQALQTNLGLGTPVSQLFVQLINGGKADFLPRGVLVNQVA